MLDRVEKPRREHVHRLQLRRIKSIEESITFRPYRRIQALCYPAANRISTVWLGVMMGRLSTETEWNDAS